MPKSARQADLNPEAADALLCPRLAALSELYALLRACARNGGGRTMHRFRGMTPELALLVVERAEHEGYTCVVEGSGGEAVATVARS